MMVYYISTTYIISIHDVFENQFGINTFSKMQKNEASHDQTSHDQTSHD